MSVYKIELMQDGAKHMRPVKTREEYLQLRNSKVQQSLIRRIRSGNVELKGKLLQMNYSCLPNEDGSLKGATRISNTVGMDIDFKAPDNLTIDEQKAWLEEQLHRVPALVLSKKDELGLVMMENSATKGYHLVFKRRPELTQEENLKWASELLGVPFDEKAKDITRVFFTTTGSDEDLIYLHDDLFTIEEVTEVQQPIVSVPVAPVAHNPEAKYNGIAYSDIIQKYWDLFNDGKHPVEGDRNALTFELAVTLRSICGFSLEKMMAVIPNYWNTENDTDASEKPMRPSGDRPSRMR